LAARNIISPTDPDAAAPGKPEAPPLVLFGIGSPFVVECVETCRRLGQPIAAAVRNYDGPVYFDDHSRIVERDAVDAALAAFPCLCPLFTPANRAHAAREARSLGFRFARSVIDPHAVIAATTLIGDGSFVNAGCIIGAATSISSQVIINRAASVGHHVAIGAFVAIGPGAIIGGLAGLGTGCLIGAGAVVLPQVKVGAFAVVGAGAVVTRDVPPRSKVMGNPARTVATDLPEFAPPDDGA
jgi:sugar O-acyltransferase (sialic acid O-acetyltransferase NeuD family)